MIVFSKPLSKSNGRMYMTKSQAEYTEVMYFSWCGYTVFGNDQAILTLRNVIGRMSLLIIIMNKIMFTSVVTKFI